MASFRNQNIIVKNALHMTLQLDKIVLEQIIEFSEERIWWSWCKVSTKQHSDSLQQLVKYSASSVGNIVRVKPRLARQN